ncbi:MAG: DMT family transporter [Deltaproteobacteria bacterium]|nr:DMT family transporter [Deltaproteobacteria bacterium]
METDSCNGAERMDYLTMAFLSMTMLGFNTFAVKLVSAHLHPGLLLVSKFGAGLIGLFIYLHYAKVPLVWNKSVVYGCLIGLWWSGIMVLYYTAIARGPLAVVIPIFNLNLIIPAVLGFVFLNEAITVSKILGLGFACVALVLLSR